jgi:hypothetical protein
MHTYNNCLKNSKLDATTPCVADLSFIFPTHAIMVYVIIMSTPYTNHESYDRTVPVEYDNPLNI